MFCKKYCKLPISVALFGVELDAQNFKRSARESSKKKTMRLGSLKHTMSTAKSLIMWLLRRHSRSSRANLEILCKAHKAAFFVKPEKHLRYEYGGCAACRNETGSFAKHEVEVFGQRFGSISELAANYEIAPLPYQQD